MHNSRNRHQSLLKRENGGVFCYTIFGEEGIELIALLNLDIVNQILFDN